ncbi:MAG: glyoxalase/bleomycin resistance/extradiol dioxygenase family protein [Bacteroidetes bacterium]|nr:glyoxalase/bleomycin resistance/extradiol dioxygenase family protein [Bacteroidota bacterium]
MEIKLIVVRTPDAKILVDFYSSFGLSFDYHKHGNSPYHYSATLGQAVLEIYPLAKGQAGPDKNLRLGFTVDNFDAVINKLKGIDAIFSSGPVETEFGYMAVVEDPDGRKIELYKNNADHD